MKIKYFFFFIIIIFVTIFFIEIISYGLLKFNKSNNQSIFTDEFQVRVFTERTNDERLITIKKNFNNQNIEKNESFEKNKWSIFTSNIRTRISERDINSKKLENPNLPKILFIGSSVPFGMGVDAESSIPYLFEEKGLGYVSINGAVPSYSLKQSVSRFIIEFKKIKNLKYVYLQIYDPASQYGILGSKWTEQDNWTNRSDQLFRRYGYLGDLLNISVPLYGKTYFFTVVKKFITKLMAKGFFKAMDGAHGYALSFNYPTENSDKRYVIHIKFQLEKLLNHLNSINVKLIIAPVTIPHDQWEPINEKNNYYLRAIRILNETIKDFSKNKNVIFIDTISILEKNFEKNFIDNCCHLSNKGADLVSSHLSKILINLK